MSSKGLLIVISGPSGVGKGTVVKALLKQRNDTEVSVSATTRQRRDGEIDGVNYHYMTEEDFLKIKEQDGFVECARFCDNYYGTLKSEVFEKLESGINIILEIEVQGAMNVRRKYPEGVFIYIMPPSMSELRARLTGRNTEPPEIVEERLKTAKWEFTHLDKYNYIVENENVPQTAHTISCIIEAEQSRMERKIDYMKERFK
ncbi:MAG: guanylate kinase [Clostridia bacterium]|nr:guanylate kinase [Clostridia bacterium]